MAYTVKITNILSLTHDVKEITTEKPNNYSYIPGQATEIAIKMGDWQKEKRPFTFTSLPSDDHLQFVIKSYRDHEGVTNKIDSLVEGDELIIDEPWGAIQFKGKGTFIAGGAGITPFISIFKNLKAKDELHGNYLIFSNKTGQDIIMESYFQKILGENFISTLTQENIEGHGRGIINMDFLKKHIADFSQEFYVCGPPAMVTAISKYLEQLGAKPDDLTFEK